MGTPPEAVDQQSNSQQIALVTGLLVVALALLWFFFLRGGGEEPEAPVTAPTTGESLPEIEGEPEAPEEEDGPTGGGGGGTPLETFDVFAPRDPFVPLIAAAATDGGTADGTADGGADGADGGDDGTANGGSQTKTGSDVGGHTVKLMDVFTDNGEQVVQVQVDGTVHTVRAGETFAQNFQVLSIQGECATFLFGDDEFTLCEGEEILK